MKLPYMPFFVDDYYADTIGLSALEHAGYILLLLAYWKRQGPLPKDDKKLAAMACMSPREWKSIRQDVLSFFEECGETLVHKRVEKELNDARERVERARSAGVASGQARRNGR